MLSLQTERKGFKYRNRKDYLDSYEDVRSKHDILHFLRLPIPEGPGDSPAASPGPAWTGEAGVWRETLPSRPRRGTTAATLMPSPQNQLQLLNYPMTLTAELGGYSCKNFAFFTCE